VPDNSFDIVSKSELTEVSNAIAQAMKEIATRRLIAFSLYSSAEQVNVSLTVELDAISSSFKSEAGHDFLHGLRNRVAHFRQFGLAHNVQSYYLARLNPLDFSVVWPRIQLPKANLLCAFREGKRNGESFLRFRWPMSSRERRVVPRSGALPRRIGWLVALAAIGNRREEWRVGFDEHAVERTTLPRPESVGLGKGYVSGERNHEAMSSARCMWSSVPVSSG